MERILVSQHEENNGTEYVVLNGSLLEDKMEALGYARRVVNTEGFKVMYSDEYFTIKQKDNKILFSSHYENEDRVGRKIYYMYLVDKQDSLETVLEYLEKDSKALNKQFDRERTLEIIQRIQSQEQLKDNLSKWILLAIAMAGAVYLISKILGNNE